MAVYREKYILDGLDEITPEMERDLDLAYDICLRLKETSPCEMCGKCCHQPFIAVRDDEVIRVSEYAGIDPYTFARDYLVRDDKEDKWLFRHTNPCAFLRSDKKCNIWKGRPQICDDFPYMVSMFMSRVYLAIVNEDMDILKYIKYMDRSWPCTKIIKDSIPGMIEEARAKRRSLLGMSQ